MMGNQNNALEIYRRQIYVCFLLTFTLLSAVNLNSLVHNPWFKFPPKYYSDGIDYEAIGWGLSHNLGLATHFSSPEWREAYFAVGTEEYDRVAQLNRPVVPRTDRPPLLPMIIAMIYWCCDDRTTAFIAMRVFSALCLSGAGAIACTLSFHFSWMAIERLSDRPQSRPIRVATKYVPTVSASICLLIAAFDQTAKSYMEDMLTELPTLMLTQLFVISLLQSLRAGAGKWWWSLAGMIFGLLFLARSISLLWLPFLMLSLPTFFFYFATSPDKTKWKRCKLSAWPLLPFLGAFLLISSPWMIRNCFVLGGFYPLGTKGSTTLVGGYCDEALAQMGNWSELPERSIRLRLVSQYGSRIEVDTQANLELEKQTARESMRQVRGWIAQNWPDLPRLFVLRIYTHFNPYTGESGIAKALAVLGILLGWKLFRREMLLMISLVLINAIVVGLLYAVGGRFFVPMYGILYIFAACGLVLGGFTLVQLLAMSLSSSPSDKVANE